MSDSAQAALKAARNKLLATTGVTSLVSTRVYNQAVQETVLPYLLLKLETEKLETIKTTHMIHRLRVQTWSVVSMTEALSVRAAVIAALHRATLSVDSPYTFSSCNLASLIDCFLEPDGKTWQALAEFEIVINH